RVLVLDLEGASAARHGDAGGREKCFEPVLDGAPAVPPRERRDALGGEASAAEQVRTGADARPGREQRADPRLDVGADERARLGDSAVDLPAVLPDAHAAVVVLEVARGGERPEVHPLGDHAVADEAMVALVAVPLPHARVD